MSHSRLAPSSAHRWVHCPGSIQMCEQMPAEPQSAAAAEGEACHWIASEVLSGRGAAIGAATPAGVVITDEMTDAAKVYVEAVHRKLEGRAAPAVCAIEQHVAIPAVHAECFGTPDCSFTDGRGELHVFDLKYGFAIVEPWDNWQMICYVAGLLQTTHQFVNIHIVQPRPFHFDGPVRTWRVGIEPLRRYITQLHDSALVALADRPLVTSGSHCKYCAARHACPAAQRVAMFAIDYTAGYRVEELSPAALAIEYRTLLRAAEAVQYRLTGLEAQAKARLGSGESIPGLALQQGAGRQQWAMTPDQLFAVGDMMGVNLRRPPDAITPAQARKAGLTDELVAAYTERLPGEAKLVPTTDTMAARVFQQKEQ